MADHAAITNDIKRLERQCSKLRAHFEAFFSSAQWFNTATAGVPPQKFGLTIGELQGDTFVAQFCGHEFKFRYFAALDDSGAPVGVVECHLEHPGSSTGRISTSFKFRSQGDAHIEPLAIQGEDAVCSVSHVVVAIYLVGRCVHDLLIERAGDTPPM